MHKSSVLVNIQEKSQKSQALGDASSSTKNRIISETTGTLALLGAGLNSPVPPAQPNNPKTAISERCHCWNSSLQCPGHVSRARVASGNTEPSGLLLANKKKGKNCHHCSRMCRETRKHEVSQLYLQTGILRTPMHIICAVNGTFIGLKALSDQIIAVQEQGTICPSLETRP